MKQNRLIPCLTLLLALPLAAQQKKEQPVKIKLAVGIVVDQMVGSPGTELEFAL